MKIIIRSDRTLPPSQLRRLFLSVGWESGDYPVELAHALRGASVLLTAWDKDRKRLVGLCEFITDGGMTAYLNYLLVEPGYQGRGIGHKLLDLSLDRLTGFRRIVLLAAPGKERFYEPFGFRKDGQSQPMAIFVR